MASKTQQEVFGGKERIRRESDFKRLFRKGKRHRSDQYFLIVSRNGLDWSRMAVSVRRKVGGAAVRNYEKRVCREFFRREKGLIRRGNDYLIIVRGKSRNFRDSYRRLREIFRQFYEVRNGA